MPAADSPSLYGITPSNTNRQPADLWGKNQFNSAFPLALCLYLRDHGINPVAILTDGAAFATDDEVWSMEAIIGKGSDHPVYHFETVFEPYQGFSRDEVDKIDLVVAIGGEHRRPLEVKLTVVPDSGTAQQAESQWAPEVVVRPVSSAYAMMGVANSLLAKKTLKLKQKVMAELRPAYNQIKNWDAIAEIERHKELLQESLSQALLTAQPLQQPFMLQPIWRTQGQSPMLCEQCLDVFVWSDVALMTLPLDRERNAAAGVSRTLREVARHVKALYDLLSTGDYSYASIYKGMALDNQTDKAFALSGRKSINYLRHPRLATPILPAAVLQDHLITGGGHLLLKPERRFDAAVQMHIGASAQQASG